MTWQRVGAIYLALLVLAGIVAYDFRPREISHADDPAAAEHSLLGVGADAPTRVSFRRGATTVVAALDGDRWRIVAPAGAPIGSDLISAAVATLTAGQSSEVMTGEGGGDLAAFGLAQPTAEVEVTLRNAPTPVRVLLGALNPTKTALYAQRAGSAPVYLVGLNVRYYLDLIFDAAAPPTAAVRTNVAA